MRFEEIPWGCTPTKRIPACMTHRTVEVGEKSQSNHCAAGLERNFKKNGIDSKTIDNMSKKGGSTGDSLKTGIFSFF